MSVRDDVERRRIDDDIRRVFGGLPDVEIELLLEARHSAVRGLTAAERELSRVAAELAGRLTHDELALFWAVGIDALRELAAERAGANPLAELFEERDGQLYLKTDPEEETRQ